MLGVLYRGWIFVAKSFQALGEPLTEDLGAGGGVLVAHLFSYLRTLKLPTPSG
jgi:hypothetical protein